MTALLQSVGVAISRREIQRRLTENRDVLRAGLQTSPWISVDDTGARHNAENGFRTPIGNRHFSWFGPAQPRAGSTSSTCRGPAIPTRLNVLLPPLPERVRCRGQPA